MRVGKLRKGGRPRVLLLVWRWLCSIGFPCVRQQINNTKTRTMCSVGTLAYEDGKARVAVRPEFLGVGEREARRGEGEQEE